jgi:hypothetical protein
MGAIGGLLGTAGGQSGTGISGPKQANIQTVATPEQVAAANATTQQGLNSQQALLAALQGQSGLSQQNAAGALQQQGLAANQSLAQGLAANNGAANQGSIYNQSQVLANQLAANNGVGNQASAMGQQQAYNAAVAGANGIGAQQQALAGQGALNSQLYNANGVGTQGSAISGLQGVAAQQAALAAQQGATTQQYQNLASGVGPNPAQSMLNQQTGQNVANQAALMAGQRGASANVGLMARQAAQQGAATQQQAVGQGATMQAQQQIAGLAGLSAQQQAQGSTIGAMGNTQSAIGNLGTTQVGQQQAGVSNMAAQGAQLAGQQQAGIVNQANQANAQIGQLQGQQAQLAGQAQNQVGNQLAGNQAVNAQANAIANQANQIAAQQIGQTNSGAASAQNAQGILTNALGAQNNATVSAQGNINNANASMANTTMQGQQGMLGGILQGAGAAMAMSDERQKTNKEHSSGRLDNMLDHLDTYSYNYKDPKFGEGRHTSVMAQDLEKSDIGRQAVVNTPEGKMVDYTQLLPAMLAANAEAHKKIKELEAQIKKYADGGEVSPSEIKEQTPAVNKEVAVQQPATQQPLVARDPMQQQQSAPMSVFGKFLYDSAKNGMPTNNSPITETPSNIEDRSQMGYGAQALQKGTASFIESGSKAVKDLMGSMGGGSGNMSAGAGEGANLASLAMMAAKGGSVPHNYSDGGGHVVAKHPSEKAVKKGDSYANDKVPAILSEGEVVIPRSVMNSKDPARGAADFVNKVLAKKKVKK